MKKKRIAKKDDIDFDKPINQEQFGLMIGVPQQTVSKLVQFCVLGPGGTLREWNIEYSRFLMGQAYARGGWEAVGKCLGD